MLSENVGLESKPWNRADNNQWTAVHHAAILPTAAFLSHILKSYPIDVDLRRASKGPAVYDVASPASKHLIDGSGMLYACCL